MIEPLTRIYAAGLYLVLQTLDMVTTFFGLRRGAVEANPVPRWLLDTHGEAAMFAAKALVVVGILLLVLLLERRYARVWFAIRFTNVMMLLVVMVNLLVFV